MNNDDITLVTAFFDIGRGTFEEMARSNENYLSYFSFWAKIKNNLVIYTNSKMAEMALKVRENYGLKEQTKVVVIDDFTKIEENILSRMFEVEKSDSFLKYRYLKKNPENKALYNYVMMLKTWCLKDAVERGYSSNKIAWIDFGFNHGGKFYSNSDDFDFKWEYKFDEKINFFCIKNDDNFPIFQKIQSFDVNIMGFLFVLPAEKAEHLWSLIRESMLSLLRIGFMDDDQLLMLMAYREDPKSFNLIKSDWFMPLKQFGGNHLSIKNTNKNTRMVDRILKGYRIFKRNYRYFNDLKKIFGKKYLD